MPDVRGRLAGAILLAGALGACATPPQTAALLARPEALPASARVAEVPFVAQTENYCGPAALAMTLRWSGVPATMEAVAPQVFTPGREGSMRADLIAAARRHGRLAVPVDSLQDLLAELAAGHPAIVFQNLGLEAYPVWHFAVAIGYELPARQIVLHSGTEPGLRLPLDTFERTWARGGHWAVVVMPPDRLPATASERDLIQAAIGLERAQRPEDASAAYQALLRRWPASFVGWMGLGNARHAGGDLAGAEAAFRRALELNPDSAAAAQNLAVTRRGRGS